MSTHTPKQKRTRYVLSSEQQYFLQTLQIWLIVNHPNNTNSPIDERTLEKYTTLLSDVLTNNGYDEEDRFIINYIRYLYLKDKDKLIL